MSASREEAQGLPGAQEARPTLWSQIRMWSGVGALGALGIFFAQNLQDVEIHFLWWTREMPMILALAFSAGAGAVAMWGFLIWRRRAVFRRAVAPGPGVR